jgi:hypothetical protein
MSRKVIAVVLAGIALAASIAPTHGPKTGDCIPLIVTAKYGRLPDGTHVAVGAPGSSTIQEYGQGEKQVSPPGQPTDLIPPCLAIGVHS